MRKIKCETYEESRRVQDLKFLDLQDCSSNALKLLNISDKKKVVHESIVPTRTPMHLEPCGVFFLSVSEHMSENEIGIFLTKLKNRVNISTCEFKV